MIDGDPPLRTRPMAPLHAALTALGATIHTDGRDGHLPVTVSGQLRRTHHIEMPGDISSQFLTALMLIGPYIPGGLRVDITTPLVSRPYVEITKAVMADFGHDAVTISERRIEVAAGSLSRLPLRDRTRRQFGQLSARGSGDLWWPSRGHRPDRGVGAG